MSTATGLLDQRTVVILTTITEIDFIKPCALFHARISFNLPWPEKVVPDR